jgi:hypothetical protein
MTSRERIEATCNHKQPDKLAVDFGGGFQTGIHASMVYKLRQSLGLDTPGTPVKVVEPYQMLGEIAPDLRGTLGLDAVSLAGTGTLFGFQAKEFKEWTFHDGTPLLVPIDFNIDPEPGGDLYQWPGGDKSVPPSGHMPRGGYFFDAIIRQNSFDEDNLNPEDNCEEFVPKEEDEIDHYARMATKLHQETDCALFCSFGGLSFGDIAEVTGPYLKNPKGIRDIEEWYVSTAIRQDYIKAVFERQAEIAIENLKRLRAAVGDKISVIQTNGTDFGTQKGPFLSVATYREVFMPYQKKINGWIHENTNWKTFMHCCGGIWPLLDSIVEAEFDILNPVQCSAACMSPQDLKKTYGDKFTFWGGGVDTQRVLPFGTPAEVRNQVRERIDMFAPGGGFVFSTIHNVQARTPLENLLAMFEAISEYR